MNRREIDDLRAQVRALQQTVDDLLAAQRVNAGSVPQKLPIYARTPTGGLSASTEIDSITERPTRVACKFAERRGLNVVDTNIDVNVENWTKRDIGAGQVVAAIPIDGGFAAINSIGKSSGAAHFTLRAGQTLSAGIGQTAEVDTGLSNDEDFNNQTQLTVYNTGPWYAIEGATGLAAIVELANGDKQLWVVHVQQPAIEILATLTNDTHVRTSVPEFDTLQTPEANNIVVLSDYPSNQTPTNATFDNPGALVGLTGDTIVARRRPNSQVYELTDMRHAIAREVFFRMTDDFPSGLGASIDQSRAQLIPAMNSTGAIPANFTLEDRFFNANFAKATDAGRATYDPAHQRYDIVECSTECTQALGTLAAGFTNTPQLFTVDITRPLDGRAPNPATGITVYNRYGWEQGTSGHEIHIIRDPDPATLSREWVPVQMRCPT